VSLEPAEIRVGDAARLTATVDHPAGGTVTLPELGRGRAIQVVERQHTTAALAGEGGAGRERTTFVVTLTSFEVGEHGVDGGTIEWAGQAGDTLSAAFPVAVLRTRSLLRGEGTPMRGIRGPVRWPPPLRRWAMLAAGAVLVLVAGVFGARLARSRRRRRPAPVVQVAGPYEAALKALAAMRGRALVDQREVERWYADVSAIVRRYLEERFTLRAPERTTEEVIREAAGSGQLAPDHQELVREFLSECDLVKFARHAPAPDAAARALAAAERLVRETKPPAPQTPTRKKGARR
jgi:hypothetical protein